jgi:hypothetical protein
MIKLFFRTLFTHAAGQEFPAEKLGIKIEPEGLL